MQETELQKSIRNRIAKYFTMEGFILYDDVNIELFNRYQGKHDADFCDEVECLYHHYENASFRADEWIKLLGSADSHRDDAIVKLRKHIIEQANRERQELEEEKRKYTEETGKDPSNDFRFTCTELLSIWIEEYYAGI